MGVFTMNELHGGGQGMKCEFGDCSNRTWSILLTDSEEKLINRNDGTASLFINQNKLGKALCDDHMKTKEIVLIGYSSDIPQELKQALADHNVKVVAETDLVDQDEYLNSFKVVPKIAIESPYSGPPRNRHERRKEKSKGGK